MPERQRRNPRQHRLYWALCQRIGSAVGAEAEHVSNLLKLSTGNYTVVKSITLGEIRVPKSIAFAAMDQVEFKRFFDACVQVICNEWGIDRPDILAAVEHLLVPAEIRSSEL